MTREKSTIEIIWQEVMIKRYNRPAAAILKSTLRHLRAHQDVDSGACLLVRFAYQDVRNKERKK